MDEQVGRALLPEGEGDGEGSGGGVDRGAESEVVREEEVGEQAEADGGNDGVEGLAGGHLVGSEVRVEGDAPGLPASVESGHGHEHDRDGEDERLPRSDSGLGFRACDDGDVHGVSEVERHEHDPREGVDGGAGVEGLRLG